MNSSERAVLHKSFKKTKDLLMRRNSSEQWSQNLIEGSSMLKTPLQWKHYYVWLANPNGYNEKEVDALKIDNTPPKIEPYPSHMKVERFQNGSDITVVVTNSQLCSSDDEKSLE